MEDVIGKLKEKISTNLGDNPEAKFDTLRSINKVTSEIKEEDHFTDYLKEKKDLENIYRLVKSKKLTTNQIRSKMKEYLKNPDDLKEFLQSILDSGKKKKEPKKGENTEATGSGSAGGYSMPLFSTTKGDIVKNVKTVREQLESGVDGDIAETEGDTFKQETKEATSSSSSGQYNQPSIWAKSMSKKDFRGYSKAQIPGGKFVQVKKKCTKFPYCNQGDIKALKIFENESVQNAIESVSGKYGMDKNYISEIVFQQIRKSQK
jgi:hypothetical protein